MPGNKTPANAKVQRNFVVTKQPKKGAARKPPVTHTQIKQVKPNSQEKKFSTGLCGCCSDCGSCCLGLFCPSVLAYRVAGKLGEGTCASFCTGVMMAPTSWVAMRTRIRTLYGIEGSIASDYCSVYCCHQLALCQMSRELKNMGL